MKRRYRPFPYVDVLTDLLAGKGYESTAKKFDYFEADKPDPTKRFRTLLRHARNVGFKHGDRIERFPEFTRQGEPIFRNGQRSPFISSLMPRKRARKLPETQSKIKLVYDKPTGRAPANTVMMVVDQAHKSVTLQVPHPNAAVSLDGLLKALSPLSGKPKKSLFETESEHGLGWVHDPTPYTGHKS
jgi:hypothetical protein